MPRYSANINKPIAKVWEHFIFKIDNPQHFVPGVSDVVVKEKNKDFTIREMTITTPDGKSARVVEKITATPYHVKFDLMDHPQFIGHVDNFAEPINENQTLITFDMRWINKSTGEKMTDDTIIKKAVLKTIDFIESND